MSEFERRRIASETLFAHGETLRFKALSRRNRAVAAWAAEKLGLTGDAAAHYAEAFARPQSESEDDEVLIARVSEAFVGAGVAISAHRIRRRFETAMAEAIAGIEAGK